MGLKLLNMDNWHVSGVQVMTSILKAFGNNKISAYLIAEGVRLFMVSYFAVEFIITVIFRRVLLWLSMWCFIVRCLLLCK